jgi:hypothetical protein
MSKNQRFEKEFDVSHGIEALICLWITLCALAFWGPYGGITLSPGLANALYASFLLTVIAIVLVRWLKSRTEAEKALSASGRAISETKGDEESGNGGS